MQVCELLKLLEVRRGQGEDKDFIECNNMTLINLVLKVLGPIHERTLTVIMLVIQVHKHPLDSDPLSVRSKPFPCCFFVSLRCWGAQWLLGSVIIWCVCFMMSKTALLKRGETIRGGNVLLWRHFKGFLTDTISSLSFLRLSAAKTCC